MCENRMCPFMHPFNNNITLITCMVYSNNTRWMTVLHLPIFLLLWKHKVLSPLDPFLSSNGNRCWYVGVIAQWHLICCLCIRHPALHHPYSGPTVLWHLLCISLLYTRRHYRAKIYILVACSQQSSCTTDIRIVII